MKFYKRFPGDINIKTGHLSPSEMGCYDRLLDHYYSTEKAIPLGKAYSICRAITAADRKACDAVLAGFFEQTEEGWVQQRTEEEIADALPRIEAARANGKKGGRPPGSGKKPKQEPNENPVGFQTETQSADSVKTSQSQIEEKVSKPSASHPPAGGKAARFDDFWLTWPKNERKQDKAKCLAHWKLHGLDAMADAILADVRTKRGTQKWSEGYIEAPLVYLRGRRWEDGVTPNEGSPAEAVANWWDSTAGIIAKGVEKNCGEWSEEIWMRTGVQWPTYKAKVFAAMGPGPWSAPPAGLPGVLKTLETA